MDVAQAINMSYTEHSEVIAIATACRKDTLLLDRRVAKQTSIKRCPTGKRCYRARKELQPGKG